MGMLTCRMRLDHIDGEGFIETEALVDTGAALTVVPAARLAEMGVAPFDTVWLSLADGHRVEYPLGKAVATVQGRTIETLVVFGEDSETVLLGAYTLEGLRFAVDPLEARLIESVGRL
ncbi:MAG: hypothetical protein OXL98_17100 [Acidimicrobiaceae bacterium]|nr:hypothetical protein [Acidimicrobiaceae bacterium]